MKVYDFCGKKGCCPQVLVGAKSVKIGEEGNICTLKKSQWTTLVRKIKSGQIQ